MRSPNTGEQEHHAALAPEPVPLDAGLEPLSFVLGLFAAVVAGGGAFLLRHFGAGPVQLELSLWMVGILTPLGCLVRAWSRSRWPKAIAFEGGRLRIPGHSDGLPAAALRGIGVARAGGRAALLLDVDEGGAALVPRWVLARGANPSALEQFARSVAQGLGIGSASLGPSTDHRILRQLSRTLAPGEALAAVLVLLIPSLVLSRLVQLSVPQPEPVQVRGVAQDRLSVRYWSPRIGVQAAAGVGFAGDAVEAAVERHTDGLQFAAAPTQPRTGLGRALRPRATDLGAQIPDETPAAVRVERAGDAAFRALSYPVEENRADLSWRVHAELSVEQGERSVLHRWQYDLVGWRRGNGPLAGDVPPVTWARPEPSAQADEADAPWLLAVGVPSATDGSVSLAVHGEWGPGSVGPFSAERKLVDPRPYFGRALAAGGGRLAVAHRGGVAVYGDLLAGSQLVRAIAAADPADDGFAQNLALSPDGRFLALGSGRDVELHDLGAGTPARTLSGLPLLAAAGTARGPDAEPQVAFFGGELAVLWGGAAGLEFFSRDPAPGGGFASSARTDLRFLGRLPGEPFGLGARLAADAPSGRLAVLVAGTARSALGFGPPSRALVLLVEPARP
ncbi:MAG: hypothetical protein GC161_14060 [Planctomycetaceae bacterium]|nr:hypothetical protein [Planctomycetaceae bacterium]